MRNSQMQVLDIRKRYSHPPRSLHRSLLPKGNPDPLLQKCDYRYLLNITFKIYFSTSKIFMKCWISIYVCFFSNCTKYHRLSLKMIIYKLNSLFHGDNLLLLMLEVIHLSRLGEPLITRRRYILVRSCHTVSGILNVRCSFRTALQSEK